ncbi:MAG TPA: Mov34/MPN/PAD-1 family protein [Candidatus Methylacidiphilales bacterium]|jgi:proteasome lid subunit RPN8/RPN11|nr:Mov34/MPN/PAD-1 family protein [Candidatus Methylacidiphilales bacterium]
MKPVYCPEPILARTLEIMQAAGSSKKERGVLWLANLAKPGIVVEAYEPVQKTSRIRFWLPPQSMRMLMGHLRATRRMIVAQVHSHPARAFHSETDNNHAVVSHAGALSVVIPHFAKGVTADNFTDVSKFFYLLPSGEWTEASEKLIRTNFEIKSHERKN